MTRADVPALTVQFFNDEHLPTRARHAVTTTLIHAAKEGFPPSVNLAVVSRQGTVMRAWSGHVTVVGPPEPTREDTLYDLASLTKVIVTTTLALWLEDQGRWRLSQGAYRWLPDLTRRDITLHQLITHTSGIVAHRPFFHLGSRPVAIRRAVMEEAARATRPGRVLYSDLNFMLLGWAIERCAGEPLDRLFARVVAEPLGLSDTRFRPGARLRARSAATELDGDQRLGPGLVRGEVHDGNAWALGGVAGHAGLFSTASDLAHFAGELLDPRHHRILSRAALTRMTRYHAGRAPDVRGLGWRLEPRGWGRWPEGTFWHTGFTGTSLLISPAADLAVVLLTNAVHPTRDLERQAAFRAEVHRALAKVNS
ncbi:MAG: beta-lactamase family protein [Acidobacteriota bacterium]|nr:beta-lactamase family protein [Acidobacteriota bacterium]